MKGIITVLGKDHVGIIGTVCTHLSRNSINIFRYFSNYCRRLFEYDDDCRFICGKKKSLLFYQMNW